MSLESRIEHLLLAATRAEREGNARLGIILKKMADELRPADRVGSYPPCPQPHS